MPSRAPQPRRYTRAMSAPYPRSRAMLGDPAVAWTLRAARPSDAVAWQALQASIYAEGHAFVGDGAPSAGALGARLRALDPVQGTVLVAVATSGELVGWVEAHRMGARRLAHVAVLTLAVAAGWRGRGLGSALMDALAAWAERHGVRKLQLHVRAANAAAIALYRRLGYDVEGVLRDQVACGTGFEDEWVMARPVGVA